MGEGSNLEGTRRKAVAVALCPDCEGELSDGLCVACSLGGLMPAPPADDGERLVGKYRLREKIAAGGMGVVWVAEDTELKRTVALKLIRGASFASESDRARFRIESEASAGLDHPNIVPIYDVGLAEGQLFFTMKLIEGGNLASRIALQSSGGLPAREVVALMEPIARAVHHAHGRGVLHRDLKPGNVLVDEEGGVWLTDFGLAKLVDDDQRLTQTSAHLGTTHYLPPEVVREGAEAASTAGDVWSLGVILWEVLYGQPPFRGSGPASVMRKIETAEPSRPAGEVADRDLHTLALRCMEKQPGRRLLSAGALADELSRWSRGEPIESRPVTAVERSLKWVRRNPVWAALGFVICAGFVSSFLLWKRAEGAVDSLTSTNSQLGHALAVSTATKLVSDARLEVGEAPTRACQLAVSAVEATEKQGFGVLPAAAEALTEVLQKVGGHGFSPFRPIGDTYDDAFMNVDWVQYWGARFSPDGRRMVVFDAFDPGGIRAAVWPTGGAGSARVPASWISWNRNTAGRELVWWGAEALVGFDLSGRVVYWDLGDVPDGATPEGHCIGQLEAEGLTLLNVAFDPGCARGLAIFGPDDGGDRRRLSSQSFELSSAETPELAVGETLAAGSVVEQAGLYVSPDMRWFVTQGVGATLFRVGAGGGRASLPMGEGETVYHSVFSPDSRWLTVREGGEKTWIFDLSSGDAEEVVAGGQVLFTSGDLVGGATFSPDGLHFAIGGATERVRVFGLAPPRLLHTVSMSKGDTSSLAFSRDGQWLAAGGTGRVVEVWPLAKLGDAPRSIVFRGLQTPVLDVEFLPGDGALLATGVGTIFRRWSFSEVGGGEVPEVVSGSGAQVIDLAVSPDRRWVATARDTHQAGGTENGVVEIADAETGESWRLGAHGNSASSVAFSVGGRWLASTGKDRTAKVWDIVQAVAVLRNGGIPEPAHVFDMSDTRARFLRRVLFHPRGTLYCACGDGVLFEWDLNEIEPERIAYKGLHSQNYLLPALAVSTDGGLLAVARHAWDEIGNVVILFDVSRPGELHHIATLPASFLEYTNLDFSPDGRWLVAGAAGEGKPALMWDVTAEDIEASRVEAPIGDRILSGVAFSPDGEVLALGGTDGEILLWNPRVGGRGRIIQTGDEIRCLKWLDETRLTSGGKNGRVEIWETDVDRLKVMALRVAGQRSGEMR